MVSARIIAGEVTTGRVLATLPVASASASTVLNAAGQVAITLKTTDAKVSALPLDIYLEPWRNFLGYVVDGQILEAGPVLPHGFDDTNGTLTVRATGMRGMFAKRRLVRAWTVDPRRSVFSWPGWSLGTIAKRVVQETLANPGGALPIALPEDVDGDHERTWYGYELKRIADVLDELTGVQGGPDIAFEPRFVADESAVEWVMRTGDPLLTQTGDDWSWDSSTRGSVSRLSVTKDPTDRVNRAWVTGSGQDMSIKTENKFREEEWERGYPLIEDAFAHSSAVYPSTLRSWASAYLSAGSRPRTEWQLTVNTDAWPQLGQYRPGDWARVTVRPDHPYLRPREGGYRSRVTAISATFGSNEAEISVMPTLEAR